MHDAVDIVLAFVRQVQGLDWYNFSLQFQLHWVYIDLQTLRNVEMFLSQILG